VTSALSDRLLVHGDSAHGEAQRIHHSKDHEVLGY
jgi:hypothetical protein